jgi:hypothetical protein
MQLDAWSVTIEENWFILWLGFINRGSYLHEKRMAYRIRLMILRRRLRLEALLGPVQLQDKASLSTLTLR